jgi:hypothetical protein
LAVWPAIFVAIEAKCRSRPRRTRWDRHFRAASEHHWKDLKAVMATSHIPMAPALAGARSYSWSVDLPCDVSTGQVGLSARALVTRRFVTRRTASFGRCGDCELWAGSAISVKKLVELILCILHPIAVVLIWIDLIGRSDLDLVPKLAWGIAAIVPIVPFVYVLTGNDFI